MRDELVKDAERMEEVCCRLAGREDIWQDRLIYWIAVSVLHLLQDTIKRRDNDKQRET